MSTDTTIDEAPDDPMIDDESGEWDVGPVSDSPDLSALLEERDAIEDEIIQAMVDWFFNNFEDPVHNTPWDGEEGGYVYIWGGPYSADEELWDAFAAMPERLVLKAIDRVAKDGFEWAPSDSRMIWKT
jgi:hypothetical protein